MLIQEMADYLEDCLSKIQQASAKEMSLKSNEEAKFISFKKKGIEKANESIRA